MGSARMAEIWRAAAFSEAARRNLPSPAASWAYIAVGDDGFARGGPAQPGDLIKIDVGCVVDGYSSDGGRTAVLGAPCRAQLGIYDALQKAFDVGLGLLAPGVPLADVYRAVAQSMWSSGFTTYGRGHFGHGVGASIWSEEWPFIAANETAIAQPGMVLAFETPYYIKGLGGFIIEDQILITNTGLDVMAAMPRDLRRI
jgi:Xaa-Pro aminopeptidase